MRQRAQIILTKQILSKLLYLNSRKSSNKAEKLNQSLEIVKKSTSKLEFEIKAGNLRQTNRIKECDMIEIKVYQLVKSKEDDYKNIMKEKKMKTDNRKFGKSKKLP
jgi:hypothetical protein